MAKNEETIERYFAAWKDQDASLLDQVFAADARYAVHPFGIEEYRGLEAIEQYWQGNTVAKQIKPEPRILAQFLEGNTAFLEWQCDYKNLDQESKQMRGMMVLEFRNGLIKELREHFETRKL